MSINWKWQNLIIAVVTSILGWLSSVFVPVPGQTPQPAPQAVTRER